MTIFSSAKNAARRALAHSYQRPGFALLRKIDELIERRYSAGFRSVQQVLPRANQVPVLLLESFSDREFLKWYQKYQPDVIITHNRRVAVEEWLRPLGLGVPRDVGWITLPWTSRRATIAFSGLDARSRTRRRRRAGPRPRSNAAGRARPPAFPKGRRH